MPESGSVERVRELLLGHLDRRMHSRWELRTRLIRRGVDVELLDAALDELERAGLVDDLAFARAFTSDRVRLAPRGYLLIIKELRSRGVDREVAHEAARLIEDEHPELEVARAFLARKRRSLESVADATRAAKLVAGWLQRRGFRSETIRRLTGGLDRPPC